MNRKNKTFGSKLYSMFLISMLISTVIAMIFFGMYYNRLAVEREEKSIQSILNSVSQNLGLQFNENENENIKSAFYIYKKIFQQTENLNNPKLYEYYDELTRIDLENNYTVTLTKTLHTSSKEVRAILFFPASGEDTAYCLSKKSAEIQEISYPDYKEEVWYKEVTEKNIDTYYCTSDMPDYMPNKGLGEIYSYVTTLKNQDTHKIIGVLKIDVSKKKLQETLDTLQKSRDHALLLVQRGQVLAKSTGLGKVGKIEDHQVRVEDRQYRTMKQTVPGTDLELIYLYSRLSIYKEFIKVTVLFFGIVMTGAVLAFFYYRFHAKRMVNDVEEISEILQCVERGELDKHIEIQGNSEFGMIAVAINQMMDHLKEYIDKEYILVIQQQKAEYRALQFQVNPHFLYNTLNGFVALNRMGEKKVLERSIIGLSRLFRFLADDKQSPRSFCSGFTGNLACMPLLLVPAEILH